MPRSSLDPEAPGKPFEFRVGIGGMPALGGIYRAGDPATIPPHKFHMLVNVRLTPSGMTNRPGLTLEYDTGVKECIDGLTGLDTPGAELLLWPGASGSSPNRNAATFRKVRPLATGYPSEFEFVELEAPATAAATLTPMVTPPLRTYGATPGDDTFPFIEPFFFRGKLCVMDYQRSAGGAQINSLPYRIFALSLPKQSGKAANDCMRKTAWATPPCPATPNLTGTLWPRGDPIGAALLMTDFPGIYNATDWMIESFAVANERDDDLLTAEVGIHEFLYVLMLGRPGGALVGERRLLRYTGSTWLLEFTPPDNLANDDPTYSCVALGIGRYGPFLVSSDSTDDWSATKGADGIYTTGGGPTAPDIVGFTEEGVWSGRQLDRRGFLFEGVPAVVYSGNRPATELATQNEGVFVITQNSSGDFETIPHIVHTEEFGSNGPFNVRDHKIAQGTVYVLATDEFDATGEAYVNVGADVDPRDERTIRLVAAGDASELWLQSLGGRILVGGRCNFDPILNAVEPNTAHAIYDITDPDNLRLLYRVYTIQQTDDAVAERYSFGCLPSFPQQSEDID